MHLVMFHVCSSVISRIVCLKWRVIRSDMKISHTPRKDIVIASENCPRELFPWWLSQWKGEDVTERQVVL